MQPFHQQPHQQQDSPAAVLHRIRTAPSQNKLLTPMPLTRPPRDVHHQKKAIVDTQSMMREAVANYTYQLPERPEKMGRNFQPPTNAMFLEERERGEGRKTFPHPRDDLVSYLEEQQHKIELESEIRETAIAAFYIRVERTPQQHLLSPSSKGVPWRAVDNPRLTPFQNQSPEIGEENVMMMHYQDSSNAVPQEDEIPPPPPPFSDAEDEEEDVNERERGKVGASRNPPSSKNSLISKAPPVILQTIEQPNPVKHNHLSEKGKDDFVIKAAPRVQQPLLPSRNQQGKTTATNDITTPRKTSVSFSPQHLSNIREPNTTQEDKYLPDSRNIGAHAKDAQIERERIAGTSSSSLGWVQGGTPYFSSLTRGKNKTKKNSGSEQFHQGHGMGAALVPPSLVQIVAEKQFTSPQIASTSALSPTTTVNDAIETTGGPQGRMAPRGTDEQRIPFVSSPTEQRRLQVLSEVIPRADDDHRFYSKLQWEVIDDCLVVSPITVFAECQGDCSGLCKTKPHSEIYFATGHENGSVNVYEVKLLATGKRVRIAKSFSNLHHREVSCLEVRDNVIFSAGHDGTVRKVDATYERIMSTYLVDGKIFSISVDENLLAIGTSEGMVSVFVLSRAQQPLCELNKKGFQKHNNRNQIENELCPMNNIIAVKIEASSGRVIACDSKTVLLMNITTPEVCQKIFSFPTGLTRWAQILEDCIILVQYHGWAFHILKYEDVDDDDDDDNEEKNINKQQQNILSSPHPQRSAKNGSITSSSAGGANRKPKPGKSSSSSSVWYFNSPQDIEASAMCIKTAPQDARRDEPIEVINLQLIPGGPSGGNPEVLHEDWGRRLVTVESNGLLRIWGWTFGQGEGGAILQEGQASSSSRLTAKFKIICDVQMNKKGPMQLQKFFVLFDRFIVISTAVGLELFNCGDPIFRTREQEIQRYISNYLESPAKYEALYNF